MECCYYENCAKHCSGKKSKKLLEYFKGSDEVVVIVKIAKKGYQTNYLQMKSLRNTNLKVYFQFQ